MNEGWLCPKCGSAHAPDVKSCPLNGLMPFPMPMTPGSPIAVPVHMDCGCPNNHVCMNVACPRRIQITCSITSLPLHG